MDLKGSARDSNARVAKYLSNAGASVPAKYADGGRAHAGKKGGITIQVNVGGQKPGMDPMAMAAMAPKPPVINPPPAPPGPPPGMAGPMPGGPPMPPPGAGGMPPGMKRGGSAKSEAGKPGPSRQPKDGDQEYGTTLMGKMAGGGRATKDPMEFGSMTGVGREAKLISQAKASKQSQSVKGTALKKQRKALGK